VPAPGEVMRGGPGRRPAPALLLPVGAALLGLAGVAWLALSIRGPSDEELVLQAAAAFLTAWEQGDWDAMPPLTTRPDDPRSSQAHADATRRLGITAVGLEAGPPFVDAERGTAELPVAVTWDLGVLGEHRFDTALALERVQLAQEQDAAPSSAWRVAWSPATLHPDLTADRRFERVRVFRPRAPILGADGAPLVVEVEVVVVGIEPQRMTDPEAVLAALAAHTDADPAAVAAVVTSPDLVGDRFYPLTELGRDRYDAVRDQLQPVPGLVFRTRPGRASLIGGGAAMLLGSTGLATAEDLERLGEPYQMGDMVGRSGLERTYERQLAGEPDLEARIVDLNGALVRSLGFVDGADPVPLQTALAPAVQAAADAATEGVAQPAAVVVVDVATGQVRAISNRPADGFNRGLAGRYPPGSTFKIVTGAAAIGAGLLPESPVACPPTVRLGGRELRNAGDYGPGTITFAEAMARSCNTAFAQLGVDTGAEGLVSAADQFGFNVEPSPGPASFGGSFPQPVDTAELAAAAIGQGRVEASPAHMASVVAAAVSGVWRPPRLVLTDEPAEERVVAPGTSAVLTTLLRGVVTTGTAAGAGLPDAHDGSPVVGKTGSAEFGTDVPRATHAWFVGVRGDLAFAVVVEGGGAGGAVAAPIAARFLATLDDAAAQVTD
jgi:cell division protein FtsI/penicillin-binding protein 2